MTQSGHSNVATNPDIRTWHRFEPPDNTVRHILIMWKDLAARRAHAGGSQKSPWEEDMRPNKIFALTMILATAATVVGGTKAVVAQAPKRSQSALSRRG
jgi:hypothetical protein